MLGMGINLPQLAAVGGVRSAAARLRNLLFGAGQQGVMYVPKPVVDGQQVLFQDSAGTTPVTADGQPVGLMLDLHKGLARGPELVTNGTFDTDITGWAGWSTATVSWIAGEMEVSGDGFSSATQVLSLEVGKTYRVTGDIYSESTSSQTYLAIVNNIHSAVFVESVRVNSTTPTKVELVFTATETNSRIDFYSVSSSFYGRADNISVRELPGNHATQATAAAKPLYRTDGTLHWLEGDGVDDELSTASLSGIVLGTSCAFTAAALPRSVNNSGYIFDIRGGGSSAFLLRQGSVKDAFFRYSNGDQPAAHPALDFSSAKGVGSGVNDDGAVASYLNSVQQASSSFSSTSSMTGPTTIKVGNGLLDMDFFGGVVIDRAYTSNERKDAERYFADLAGVTLS